MSDELISRKDAIEAIDASYDGVAKDDYDYGLQDGMNRARYIIEDLPAASPEPRWIRSSERLPELSERVLVCDGEYVSMSMLGRVYNGSYVWLFDTFWNDLEDLPYWMPLPKPPMKEGD